MSLKFPTGMSCIYRGAPETQLQWSEFSDAWTEYESWEDNSQVVLEELPS